MCTVQTIPKKIWLQKYISVLLSKVGTSMPKTSDFKMQSTSCILLAFVYENAGWKESQCLFFRHISSGILDSRSFNASILNLLNPIRFWAETCFSYQIFSYPTSWHRCVAHLKEWDAIVWSMVLQTNFGNFESLRMKIPISIIKCITMEELEYDLQIAA